MVIANGKGISVFTKKGLEVEKLTGFAWLFIKGTKLEAGLKLIDDEKPEHYTLAPEKNMSVEEYKSLLAKMGVKCDKYLKLNKNGTMVRV